MSSDARFLSSRAGSRALLIVTFVAFGLAVVVGAASFTVWSPGADVILEVETVALEPSPAEPLTPEAVEQPSVGARGSVITPSASQPVSPPPSTADLDVGANGSAATGSEPAPPAAWIPPTQLTIGDLDRADVVRPVGLDDKGAMVIPEITEVGWYLHGAVPGQPGATVLVAHVSWGGSKGPFHRLGALDLGASIEVRGDDGVLHGYEVVERTMYDKDSLPSNLWRKTGPETLVLITCGGTFDHSRRSYDQNIVVYATPTGAVTEAIH